MGETGGVGGAQAERRHPRQLDGLVGRQRAAAQALGQGLAVDVLHREEQPAVVLADEVDVADVGVDQAGLRARLADQALAAVAVAADVGEQQLERHRAIERQIGGQPHLAHAALAELPLDAEVREPRAGAERRVVAAGPRRAGDGRGAIERIGDGAGDDRAGIAPA